MNIFKKNIIIFSRKNITNYGDPIIGDCCKYIIETTAKKRHMRVNVTILDIYGKDTALITSKLKKASAVVFPGGGVNSVAFNKIILEIFEVIEQYKRISVYFNAIGILKVNPNPKNEALLKIIFNKDQVKQITTRGDLGQLKTYITSDKPYPEKLVLDPAIWVNEAYNIQRDTTSDLIGIGVIRPEIYQKNGSDISSDDVLKMYTNIIRALDRRGYKWQLFSNGMKDDYNFGLTILDHLGLDKNQYIGRNTKNSKDLVQKISQYKAIIAARLHANIIATALSVPSVGLVWNDKMNLFADMIGCRDRYLSTDYLLDGEYIADTMERAVQEGYDTDRINSLKDMTQQTILNILS